MEKRAPTLDLQSLRALFDRLGEVEAEVAESAPAGGVPAGESADPGEGRGSALRADRARELRYFVALLLLRKRMLRICDPKTPEQERADLVVIDPKAEQPEPIALFAPELDTDRLAGLKDELVAALEE
ncbi:MAG: hypothetical protein IPM29_05480 [Planctomycetes bacterium]|nr:hypothetical protein [Planctomycetota bacterium]